MHSLAGCGLGHADLSFTKRVYIHPNVEHLRQAADQLNDLYG